MVWQFGHLLSRAWRTLAESHGITRGVVEEGQQHFDTQAEALSWIESQQKYMPQVYRDDGLVVAWDKRLERKQLNVEVWQIYIGGVKPTSLPGSQNEKALVDFNCASGGK